MSAPASELVPAAAGDEAPAVQRWAGLRRLIRDPLGLLGLILVGLVVFAAVFADWLAPYGPNTLDVPSRLQDPSENGGAIIPR